MGIEICPLAADVGNWADWAAVVVGLGAAAGTIWVASVANRTSRRATEIADDAKAIAKQQHEQALAQQRANAEILGRLLLHEIASLPMRLSALRAPIAQAVKIEGGTVLIEDSDLLRQLLEDAKFSVLPESERVLSRIHDLPDGLGPDLATLIGQSAATRDMAYRMLGRVIESPRQFLGQNYRFTYRGRPDDFELFEDHLRSFKGMSEAYAERFRLFVGAVETDFGRLS
jgi:hypothetical protein